MKKFIKLFIGFLIFGSISYLSFKIINKLNHKKEVAKRTKNIPNFSFYTSNGKPFSKNDLANKPTVFLYFNSECDFCKSEATKIQEHLNDFKDVQLVFVSFEPSKNIETFAVKYKLNNKKNIVFLEDRKGVFSELFDVNSIPYIVVYDKNQQFIKKFKGATKIDAILKVLKK